MAPSSCQPCRYLFRRVCKSGGSIVWKDSSNYNDALFWVYKMIRDGWSVCRYRQHDSHSSLVYKRADDPLRFNKRPFINRSNYTRYYRFLQDTLLHYEVYSRFHCLVCQVKHVYFRLKTSTNTPPARSTAMATCPTITSTGIVCNGCTQLACLKISTVTPSCGPIPTTTINYPCCGPCPKGECGSTSYVIAPTPA